MSLYTLYLSAYDRTYISNYVVVLEFDKDFSVVIESWKSDKGPNLKKKNTHRISNPALQKGRILKFIYWFILWNRIGLRADVLRYSKYFNRSSLSLNNLIVWMWGNHSLITYRTYVFAHVLSQEETFCNRL
jgi:hypothetical protein